MKTNRRQFIKNAAAASAGIAASSFITKPLFANHQPEDMFFKISLAQWSLHRMLFDGKLTNLEFPVKTKKDFGIDAVEYVSTFFKGCKDKKYMNELLQITKDNGVENVLIMVDGEGSLGDLYEPKRIQAVERHYRWVEAAKFLGCHSIRVNARGNGSAEEVGKTAADGLARLSEFAAEYEIGVIVENHGGYSSDGKWLSEVIKNVGMDNCGTLPDFGNFCVEHGTVDGKRTCTKEYDKYLGTKELMEYAKGVSAKTLDFNEDGTQKTMDYKKLLQIVKDAGYTGYIGIEYSGKNLGEEEGIMATKKLLLETAKELG